MTLTTRLEQALIKLYSAYYSGSLNPECCKQCAVGNILDNSDSWQNFSDEHGSLNLNYVGKVNEVFGKRFNGYLPSELLKIEVVFLEACGFKLPYRKNSSIQAGSNDDELLFKGLSAVISYLCQLDGVNDVMEYNSVMSSLRPIPNIEEKQKV